MGNASGGRRGPGRPAGNQRLIVWDERREEPDWDGYVSALLDFAMRQVEEHPDEELRLARVLSAVAEKKYWSELMKGLRAT